VFSENIKKLTCFS